MRRGDASFVARSAHQLKGSSLVLGAMLVASLAAELETRAEHAQLTDADECVRSLERALEPTAAALRTVLLADAPGQADARPAALSSWR